MLALHLLIATSINHFLHPAKTAQGSILLAFAALSGAFPYSYIRLRKAPSAFIQRAYQISALWLGIAINLSLAAALNWLLEGLRAIFHLPIPNPAFFAGTMAIATAYSIYGVWNAFSPKLTTYTTTIEGLPEHWHNKKLVHISDLHIGYIFGRQHLQRAVNRIRQIDPHMAAITGDLADSIQKDIPRQMAPLASLAREIPVLFAPGNHDPRDMFHHLEKAGVTVLDDRAIRIEGLQIAGASCEPRNSPPRPIATSIEGYQRGLPTILLKHIPSHIQASKDSGVHLQLSGHTHAGQQFPFSIIARRIYKRFNSGFHTIGNFSINISMGLGTWGPPMRTTTNPEITVITLKGTDN
jgi:predicted MPP superfamily phosphohydrolase